MVNCASRFLFLLSRDGNIKIVSYVSLFTVVAWLPSNFVLRTPLIINRILVTSLFPFSRTSRTHAGTRLEKRLRNAESRENRDSANYTFGKV